MITQKFAVTSSLVSFQPVQDVRLGVGVNMWRYNVLVFLFSFFPPKYIRMNIYLPNEPFVQYL